jgi:hypothetical protein
MCILNQIKESSSGEKKPPKTSENRFEKLFDNSNNSSSNSSSSNKNESLAPVLSIATEAASNAAQTIFSDIMSFTGAHTTSGYLLKYTTHS